MPVEVDPAWAFDDPHEAAAELERLTKEVETLNKKISDAGNSLAYGDINGAATVLNVPIYEEYHPYLNRNKETDHKMIIQKQAEGG